MNIEDVLELSKKELGADPTGHDFFMLKELQN